MKPATLPNFFHRRRPQIKVQLRCITICPTSRDLHESIKEAALLLPRSARTIPANAAAAAGRMPAAAGVSGRSDGWKTIWWCGDEWSDYLNCSECRWRDGDGEASVCLPLVRLRCPRIFDAASPDARIILTYAIPWRWRSPCTYTP